MTTAIVVRSYGGSEVLCLEDTEIPAPGPNEIRVRQAAIGVNFHDVYVRSGLYKTLDLPGIPGCEAVGEVEAIGADVTDIRVGDRVAYVVGPPYGAYASHRILPANKAVPVPAAVSDTVAAGNFLRALTVDMLTNRVTQLRTGMTVLVHAAAGGVGRLLCQMAAHQGAHVIGTVGSEDKARIAQKAGCHQTILYRTENFVDVVSDVTQGRGVDVTYDSVGADTFAGSLDATSPCGHVVNFGQSSGAIAPIAMSQLAEKSLTVTRPILFHYMANRASYEAMAQTVFDAFQTGVLTPDDAETYPLAQTSAAHDRLESRMATKPLVLVP